MLVFLMFAPFVICYAKCALNLQGLLTLKVESTGDCTPFG